MFANIFGYWIDFILRVCAGVGTAVAAWFVLGPLLQMLARIAIHRKIPPLIMIWLRLLGAALLGFLVYYYLPIGGGPGFGPGSGGPGEGTGSGLQGKDGKQPPSSDGDGKQITTETTKEKTEKAESPKEILQIELLGGTRYKRDERYYLLDRKEPAKTLNEVDELLKEHVSKYKIVHVVLTPESVSEEDPAVRRLQHLVQQKYKLAAPLVLP